MAKGGLQSVRRRFLDGGVLRWSATVMDDTCSTTERRGGEMWQAMAKIELTVAITEEGSCGGDDSKFGDCDGELWRRCRQATMACREGGIGVFCKEWGTRTGGGEKKGGGPGLTRWCGLLCWQFKLI
jgi:hypothetical protein